MSTYWVFVLTVIVAINIYWFSHQIQCLEQTSREAFKFLHERISDLEKKK